MNKPKFKAIESARDIQMQFWGTQAEEGGDRHQMSFFGVPITDTQAERIAKGEKISEVGAITSLKSYITDNYICWVGLINTLGCNSQQYQTYAGLVVYQKNKMSEIEQNKIKEHYVEFIKPALQKYKIKKKEAWHTISALTSPYGAGMLEELVMFGVSMSCEEAKKFSILTKIDNGGHLVDNNNYEYEALMLSNGGSLLHGHDLVIDEGFEHCIGIWASKIDNFETEQILKSLPESKKQFSSLTCFRKKSPSFRWEMNCDNLPLDITPFPYI